jgi:hypothetical protein
MANSARSRMELIFARVRANGMQGWSASRIAFVMGMRTIRCAECARLMDEVAQEADIRIFSTGHPFGRGAVSLQDDARGGDQGRAWLRRYP